MERWLLYKCKGRGQKWELHWCWQKLEVVSALTETRWEANGRPSTEGFVLLGYMCSCTVSVQVWLERHWRTEVSKQGKVLGEVHVVVQQSWVQFHVQALIYICTHVIVCLCSFLDIARRDSPFLQLKTFELCSKQDESTHADEAAGLQGLCTACSVGLLRGLHRAASCSVMSDSKCPNYGCPSHVQWGLAGRHPRS